MVHHRLKSADEPDDIQSLGIARLIFETGKREVGLPLDSPQPNLGGKTVGVVLLQMFVSEPDDVIYRLKNEVDATIKIVHE